MKIGLNDASQLQSQKFWHIFFEMCSKPGRSCFKKMLHFYHFIFLKKHSLIFVGKHFLLLSFGKIAVARYGRVFCFLYFFKYTCSRWDSCTGSRSLVVVRVHLTIFQGQCEVCLCHYWCFAGEDHESFFTDTYTCHLRHVVLNWNSIS